MEFVTPNVTNLITTAVGFILFVWVLGKFAWDPVLGLLDERRGKIEGDYAAAEKHLVRVSAYTGQPETQGGLVKTLDFKIYLGLLSETYNDAHRADLGRTGAEAIDMVVMANRGTESHFDFGSVADRVLKCTTIPVVMVPA